MEEQNKSRLAIYIVVSILFSAVCWIVPLLNAQENGYLVPTAANFFTLLEKGFQNSEHSLISLLFAAATFGPFIGALVAVGLESGNAGLKKFFQRVGQWRVEGQWYVAIIIITAAITILPTIIAKVLGVSTSKNLILSVPWYFYLLLFLFQLLTSGLGEEVGWRGYLLPELYSSKQGDKAIWFNGLIWAV